MTLQEDLSLSSTNFYGIFSIKAKVEALNNSLRQMQVDFSNEADHYENACNLAKTVENEISQLIPDFLSSNQSPSFESGILIDDDAITALSWNHAGKQVGKKVIHFPNEESFFSNSSNYPKDICIYIDWFLSPDVNSFEIIKQIASLGFSNIIITTNAFDLNMRDIPWVKAIISKDPPWSGQEARVQGGR